MRNPKTQLELFLENGGRGDVLSMSKEDVARIYKLPKRIYAPIIHALMTWFMTGERVSLGDPRDDGMLEGFIEHQKANADKRREFLERQLELANRSVASRKSNKPVGKPRFNHGSTMVQPPLNQVKVKGEDKDEVIKSLSSPGGVERSRTDAATFTPKSGKSVRMSEAAAKKFLAMNVPEGKISSMPDFRTSKGNPNAFYLELFGEGKTSLDRIETISNIMHDGLSENELQNVRAAFDDVLAERCRQMESEGLSGFDAALVKAHLDALGDDCKNPDALVIDRINRTIAAKKALAKKS